ncbi:uncharacterized protein LOC128727179 [Anopheles nili]|uniref:uncharacterized protein LOC128727179 n=1 Tax=Anopheles nili TaxID=185578 RepID=UPI00237B9BA9|nr:uncharacterized protein LOC128727179 [Anopheles nili]
MAPPTAAQLLHRPAPVLLLLLVSFLATSCIADELIETDSHRYRVEPFPMDSIHKGNYNQWLQVFPSPMESRKAQGCHGNQTPLQRMRLLPSAGVITQAIVMKAGGTIARQHFAPIDLLCKDVLCPECPPDSYPLNEIDTGSNASDNDDDDGDGDSDENDDTAHASGGSVFTRVGRAIAMNHHAHGPIKITPSALQFLLPNILQVQPRHRHQQKRSTSPSGHIVETVPVDFDRHLALQDRCCPKCACHACQPANCTRSFRSMHDDEQPAPAGQPGNCCPEVLCPMCHSDGKARRMYFDGDQVYDENPCKQNCRCSAGQIICQIPFCKPLNCPHKKQIADQCCPVCDESMSIFCSTEDINCDLSCQYGYVRQAPDGCAYCKCASAPINDTITTTANWGAMPTMVDSKQHPAVTTSDATNNEAEQLDTSSSIVSDPVDLKNGAPNEWRPKLLIVVIAILVMLFLGISYLWSLRKRGWCVKNLPRLCLQDIKQMPASKSDYNRVSSMAPPVVTSSGSTPVGAGCSMA